MLFGRATDDPNPAARDKANDSDRNLDSSAFVGSFRLLWTSARQGGETALKQSEAGQNSSCNSFQHSVFGFSFIGSAQILRSVTA